MGGFQGTKDSFGGLVEAGHEFPFIDNVAAKGKLADANGVFKEIHKSGLFGFSGTSTEKCLKTEHMDHGVLQGAANALQ
jgi:hypothetical protein